MDGLLAVCRAQNGDFVKPSELWAVSHATNSVTGEAPDGPYLQFLRGGGGGQGGLEGAGDVRREGVSFHYFLPVNLREVVLC